MPLVAPLPAPAFPSGPSLWSLLAGLPTPAGLAYESSEDLCRLVSAICGQRLRPAINLGTSGSGVAPATGHRGSVPATPYRLLHAIGETVRAQSILPPPLAAYSAHWAVVGYLWSLRPPAPPPMPLELRLSPYAQTFAGRQRGIWSEVMAIGVANVLLAESLASGETASALLDVDRWLAPAVAAGVLTHIDPRRRPDYLAVRYTASGPEVLVIECKGTGGARGSGRNALARGIPQVMAIGAGTVPVRRWVVAAACSRNAAGSWHPQVVEVTATRETPSEADRPSTIEPFERVRSAQTLEVVGDLELAHRIAPRRGEDEPVGPSLPHESQVDDRGRSYVGRTLRVGFGDDDVEVFLGLDEQIRLALETGDVIGSAELRRQRTAELQERTRGEATRFVTVRRADGTSASLSAEGTLLSVAGSTAASYFS